MQKIIFSIILTLSISGCYSIETNTNYNRKNTWAHAESKPIHVKLQNGKHTPFYFLLSRNSNNMDYKLTVRWKNAGHGDILFNGFDTTLKFLIDKTKFITLHPVSRPKVIAFNLNNRTHEEEGIFILTPEQFKQLAFAKYVSIELTGRGNTVYAAFNLYHTSRAFKDFFENSPQ